jgi:hypothetical protein
VRLGFSDASPSDAALGDDQHVLHPDAFLNLKIHAVAYLFMFGRKVSGKFEFHGRGVFKAEGKSGGGAPGFRCSALRLAARAGGFRL